MGWVHPSGLGGQNAAVGIEDTGSPPHPRRLVMAVHDASRDASELRRNCLVPVKYTVKTWLPDPFRTQMFYACTVCLLELFARYGRQLTSTGF